MGKKFRMIISSLICAFILIGNVANTYAMSTTNIDNSETQIINLNEDNFIIKDEEGTVLMCSVNKDANTINIVDQNGTESIATTDISYNEDGVVEQYVTKIDGEVVATLELSKDDSNSADEISEDEGSSLARASYSYTLLNRYTMTANATKTAAQIAVAIISVVGIWAGYGDAVAIGQIIIGLYKEHKTIKYPPLSLNVLYAKNAPQSIQVKKVFRIYKDSNSSKLASMTTYYSALPY